MSCIVSAWCLWLQISRAVALIINVLYNKWLVSLVADHRAVALIINVLYNK